MNRNPIVRALALAALVPAAATCRDSASPSPPVSLSATSRRDSLPVDSVNLRQDSVRVTFTDSGGAPVQWTVTHGGASWIALVTTAGSGNGFVRWTRDPSELLRGIYVDTITIAAAALHSAVSVIDSLTITGALPAFVTSRRAWLPGERDAMVARLSRDSTDGLFFSAQVAQYLAGADSVTVLIPNPDLAPSAAALQRAPMLGQAGQTWILVSLDISLKFPQAPGSALMDSLNWLGVSWYASPESTWKGRVVIGTTAATQLKKLNVNTALFDANFDTTGAGGGEARASLGQYWEANAGQIQISKNVCSPASCAASTFTSGPWLGGTWYGIALNGSLITIVAPCISSGCTAPPDTFNVAFTKTPVNGFAITCVFPSPCTGPGPAVIARLQQRRSLRALMLGGTRGVRRNE